MSSRITKEEVLKIIKNAKIEPLTLPVPPRIDHADHIIKTALMGWTKLAADHILHPEFAKMVKEVFSALIRRVDHMIKNESILDSSGKLVKPALVRLSLIHI